MKIYYVYHSCFIAETESSFFIFDYWKHVENVNSDINFNLVLNEIYKSSKPLYIFISHNHHDHFNQEIFSWAKNKKDTYYILSDDIKLYQESINNLYAISANNELTLNNLTINTFDSTDEGISFLINIEGLNIFHAGDLNWWKWLDDTTEEEKEMEGAFKAIVDDIINKNTSIDIAFFPVDKRLEDNYYCGGEYFIEKLHPKVFIPMHFGEDFKTTQDFKLSQQDTSTNIIEISYNNEILLTK